MAETFESRTITVRIARSWRDVYDSASAPENVSRWASGLGRSLNKAGDEWIADAPGEPATVRFIERNDFGILEHHVAVRPGSDIYIPMRVIANGTDSEVMLRPSLGTPTGWSGICER